MMALINPDNALIDDCFEKNTHSLRQQSKPGTCLEDGLGRSGNPDGWAFVSYQNNKQIPIVSKSVWPAYIDPKYQAAVNKLTKQKSEIIFAHVRSASIGSVTVENCHPFTYKNWSFEHNGDLIGAVIQETRDKINGKYAEILGNKPLGQTDSEAAFFYFLGRMKETYKTTDTKIIGTDNTRKIFAQSMKELIDKSSSPTCNIIVSDGENVFALKYGRSLYLGQQQKQFIISSEKTDKSLEESPVSWQEIPEGYILTISKNNQSKPVLTSFADLVKK